MRNVPAIAFIGFGEVGQTFAKGFLASHAVSIAAHDRLFAPDLSDDLAQKTRALGVSPFGETRQALAGADIVISAVTASEAEPVAALAAQFLKPGQVFFDINSAAPSTKTRAAALVAESGAHYVEGAVMAPVLKPGLLVPILTGGPEAASLSERLNALGMNLTPVATDYGRASAMKLCRSIIIKGLEALMVDCAQASTQWDVQAEVFASLAETFPSIDWHALSANMAERVATHGIRRSAEMREAGEMLTALGMDPGLSLAVADAQWRGARQSHDAAHPTHSIGHSGSGPCRPRLCPDMAVSGHTLCCALHARRQY